MVNNGVTLRGQGQPQRLPLFTIYALDRGFVIANPSGEIAVTDDIDLLEQLSRILGRAQEVLGTPPVPGAEPFQTYTLTNTNPPPAEVASRLGLPFHQPPSSAAQTGSVVVFKTKSGRPVRAVFGRDSDNPPLPPPPDASAVDLSDPGVQHQIRNVDIANSKLIDAGGGYGYTRQHWEADVERWAPDIPLGLAEQRLSETIAELREDAEES